MKVYSLPKEVPAPELSWGGDFNLEKMIQDEKDHCVKLKAHLIKMGYTGEHTGKIYKSQIADGYASYMFADRPRHSCLIHLPYGDAYDDRDVEFLPKKEVLARIKQDEKFAKMCGKARKETKV